MRDHGGWEATVYILAPAELTVDKNHTSDLSSTTWSRRTAQVTSQLTESWQVIIIVLSRHLSANLLHSKKHWNNPLKSCVINIKFLMFRGLCLCFWNFVTDHTCFHNLGTFPWHWTEQATEMVPATLVQNVTESVSRLKEKKKKKRTQIKRMTSAQLQ